eukprot:6103531-Prorocentrum_lima.AAC.1
MTRKDPDPVERQADFEDDKAQRSEPLWVVADALQAAFPTDSRMRHKAKEAAIKLETGKKH